MTVTLIKVMIALGIVGHAINMYCDRILSIFPNGTIKFDNINGGCVGHGSPALCGTGGICTGA